MAMLVTITEMIKFGYKKMDYNATNFSGSELSYFITEDYKFFLN